MFIMLKKPSILTSTFGGLPSLATPYSYCSDPLPRPPPSTLRPTTKGYRNNYGRGATQWRGFADVKAGHKRSETQDDLQWPDLISATATPTPYQIFKQKRGAPYSKRRFYELCKIYHPDRKHHHDFTRPGCLSQAVRLERYRLIIAANEILSDPAKRRAYDTFGAGWNGMPAFGGSNQAWGNTTSTGWSGFDHNSSPARNATWEDWEKWYQRDKKEKQEPRYFSNGGFVVLIVFFTALGTVGEISRMGNYSKSFIEQVEARHDESSKHLMRKRRESQSFNNKDERVQSFLKTRDPMTYGLADGKGEAYRRMLPAPEVCMSGDIVDRGVSTASNSS